VLAVEDKARRYLAALGGAENIKDIDGCITRLRMTLVDPSKIDLRGLQQAGMIGRPMVMGKGVQVVVGTYAELIGSEINRIIKAG
jgi:glucose-like phosphotransferase system IIB component